MAKRKRKRSGSSRSSGIGSRGWVVVVALVVAALAFFVLFRDSSPENGPAALRRPDSAAPQNAPALDEIDAESRAKMRDLLRQAGEEE